MRTFEWIEPGDDDQPVTRTITDAEILSQYFPHWCEQMRRVGKADQISDAACIDDFVTVHWAYEKPHGQTKE